MSSVLIALIALALPVLGAVVPFLFDDRSTVEGPERLAKLRALVGDDSESTGEPHSNVRVLPARTATLSDAEYDEYDRAA
ncbi:hypothetical protein [Thermomonospora catenispora]|uniref:hypothetical protein n=1 Tax=Thermomonospora catenispora TaxID=2493090 RepID=UPI0011202287|nr:hypothetical protein [Thermomonospora catenispora]TNY36874.1 hypothetical protein EIO00_11280 [Thermomonospora catenispora]